MSKTTYVTKRTTVVNTECGPKGRFLPKSKKPASKAAAKTDARPETQAKPALPVMPKRFSLSEIDYRDDSATVTLCCDTPGVMLLLEIQSFLRKNA